MFEKFALFVHIIGAIGLFAGMALQISGLWAFRRATTVEQVRGIISGSTKSEVFFPISGALIMLSGLYLAYQASQKHHDVSWAMIALATYVIIAIVSGISAKRDTKIIQTKVDASNSRFTTELHETLQDPKLLTVPVVSAWILAGVVALMVFRPNIAISIIIVTAALAIGFAHVALMGRDQQKLS